MLICPRYKNVGEFLVRSFTMNCFYHQNTAAVANCGGVGKEYVEIALMKCHQEVFYVLVVLRES